MAKKNRVRRLLRNLPLGQKYFVSRASVFPMFLLDFSFRSNLFSVGTFDHGRPITQMVTDGNYYVFIES